MRVIFSTTVGVLLVLVALRDVVHELLDPDDSGSLSRGVMHGVWRMVRAAGRRHRPVINQAGALVLLAVAGTWTTLVTVGFGLVYWPRLPGAFYVNAALPPSAGEDIVTALYVSLASLTTLNSNEITPLAPALRIAFALQSLVGMGLITAWITWVLSIYPVLARRRAFAREVDLVQRAYPKPESALVESSSSAAADLLRSMTEQTLRIGAELSQSRVTYYFQNPSPELSLARQLPYVLGIARAAECMREREAMLGHRGALLRSAVESLVSVIGVQFLDLRDSDPDVVLAALARDHLLPEPREREAGAARSSAHNP